MQNDPRWTSGTFISRAAVLPAGKRFIDVVCCVAALPLLGLVTIVFGIIAGTVGKGPVFFRQPHVGYRGGRFMVYRFRTMHVRSRATNVLASSGRPPLIPGGRFLRASGLVDLPQIVNVLRREMSIVGPRPLLEDEARNLGVGLMNAVPGVTGYWRVARRNANDLAEIVQRDLAYGESRSLWLDSKIILLTLPAVLANAWSGVVSSSRGNVATIRTPSRQPW